MAWNYMRLPLKSLKTDDNKSKDSQTLSALSEDSNISKPSNYEFDSESHVKIVVIKF